MKVKTASRAAGLCVSFIVVGGCAAPGPSPSSFAVQRLPGADSTAAFEQAERALISLGHRIDQRDRARGIITTQPISGAARDEPRRRTVSLSGPRAARRVCEVLIAGDDGGVSVYCRVAVQELSTEAHRLSARDHGISDTPDHTPIDREGATTRDQNQVWRTIRRDRVMEREVLAAIAALADKPPTATPNS
jgi:hypothetical protein